MCRPKANYIKDTPILKLNTMNEVNKKFEAALAYQARDIAVVPIKLEGNKKRPYVKWKDFQKRLPTEQEIRGWWKLWPNAEVGAVTGLISNLAVIDFEKGAKMLELPDTVTAESGGGGIHKYFRYPKRGLKSPIKVWPLTDIRADGGIIVMPPSGHHSGGNYKWIQGFDEIELAEFPEHLLDLIDEQKNLKSLDLAVLGVDDGVRNETATSMAGTLLRNYLPQDWEPFCWPLLQGWNKNNKPPADEPEFRKTFESIKQAETLRRQSLPAGADIQAPVTLKPVLWKDFCSQADPAKQWLVEGLIPAEGVGILASPAGEKKTWFILALAVNVADGTPFLNHFPVTQGAVMYIENEMPESELRKRGRQLGLDSTKEPVWLVKLDGHMNSPEAAAKIIKFAQQNKVKLIIADTFRALAGGLKEEDAGEIRAFFNLYKPLKDMGVFLIFLDHTRKLQTFDGFEPKLDQIFGSQDKKGCTESILMIRSPGRSKDISVYHLRCRIAIEQEPFKATIEDVVGEYGKIQTVLNFAGAPDHVANKKEEAVGAILSIIQNEQRSRKQLLELLLARNIKERNASEALREMEKDGRIIATRDGREKVYSISGSVAETGTVT